MTTPAFTRLLRVLDLEERQSWRNRSVIGGMRAMAARWAEDARAEGVDPSRLQLIIWLMQQFDAAAPADRPQLASQLRNLLADDWQPAAAVQAVEAPAEEVDAGVIDMEDHPPTRSPAQRTRRTWRTRSHRDRLIRRRA